VGKQETIYSAEKLARFLGVTKATIREWCKQGKLPGFKIGKEWKVRTTDLQKLIGQKVKTRGKAKTERQNAAQRLF